MENDDRQRSRNEHCTRDEKQTCDVAGMFHHARHYQTNYGLKSTNTATTLTTTQLCTGFTGAALPRNCRQTLTLLPFLIIVAQGNDDDNDDNELT